MNDWKKKIDDLEKTQYLEQKEKEAKQKQNQEEQEQRVRNLKISELGRKFKCHIPQCGKLPTEPYIEKKETSADWSRIVDIVHWDIPGDLWKCVFCRKWTCKEHLYKGICQECAEKM